MCCLIPFRAEAGAPTLTLVPVGASASAFVAQDRKVGARRGRRSHLAGILRWLWVGAVFPGGSGGLAAKALPET